MPILSPNTSVGSGTEIPLGALLPSPYNFGLSLDNKLQIKQGSEVIFEQDNTGAYIKREVLTGTGSVVLGDIHSIASVGENVVFRNEVSDVIWFPVWQGISEDGQVNKPPTSRNFSAFTTVSPDGALGSSIVPYESMITTSGGSACVFSVSFKIAEDINERLIWTVLDVDDGNREITSFIIDPVSWVSGSTQQLNLKYPIFIENGHTLSSSLRKFSSGEIVDVYSTIDFPTKPWRSLGIRSYTDEPIIDVTRLGAINGVATLDNAGKVPLNQLPNIDNVDRLTVADQAARYALPVSTKFRIVLQLDTNIQWYIEANDTPSVPSNWAEGGYVGTQVVSFNGRNGAVMPLLGDYTAALVGAVPAATADGNRRVIIGNTPTLEPIVDNLTSSGILNPLSANQGYTLKSQLDSLSSLVNTKQNCLCDTAIAVLKANGGNNTTTTAQGGLFSTNGSAQGVAMADSEYGRVRKLQYRTTSMAGNTAVVRGTAAYSLNTGFKFVSTWSIDSGFPSNMRSFIGFDTIDLPNAAISTRTNCFGVGFDSGDTNYSLIQNDGSGSAGVSNLGANFPKGNAGVNIYTLEMNCQPLSNIISYKLTRRVGGAGQVTTGTFVTSNLPAAGSFLRPVISLQTTTNSAVGLGFISMYIETLI